MIELDVGPVAHGGHCVARLDGRVVFVRHALPGERVQARVTQERRDYLRADAVTVLERSPDRVEPPCPFARPDACGGCDFQHATPAAQRTLKANVLAEQLSRLADLDVSGVPVEPLASDQLGWRTRVQFAVDAAGRLGFHKHRSHAVVPVDRCLIAHPAVRDLPAADRPDWPAWPAGGAVEAVASSGGDVTVLMRHSRTDRQWSLVDGAPRVREKALGQAWSLDATGFWQVHPAAPERFAAVVLELLQPRAGERAWDLYGGAGLFAAALAPHCGPVSVVEADRRAVAAGRQALGGLDNVRFVAGDVARTLANPRWRAVDVVVLDPPRAGAGRDVVAAIARRAPRAVAYVACDPAAFARDVRSFAGLGYRLDALRAFDAFPMTHHLEAIGLFRPG
jgi:tRNA/tmRNA/rRNA uracil-C5-methylase (TrmA/RlmC/RlmD family)